MGGGGNARPQTYRTTWCRQVEAEWGKLNVGVCATYAPRNARRRLCGAAGISITTPVVAVEPCVQVRCVRQCAPKWGKCVLCGGNMWRRGETNPVQVSAECVWKRVTSGNATAQPPIKRTKPCRGANRPAQLNRSRRLGQKGTGRAGGPSAGTKVPSNVTNNAAGKKSHKLLAIKKITKPNAKATTGAR